MRQGDGGLGCGDWGGGHVSGIRGVFPVINPWRMAAGYPSLSLVKPLSFLLHLTHAFLTRPHLLIRHNQTERWKESCAWSLTPLSLKPNTGSLSCLCPAELSTLLIFQCSSSQETTLNTSIHFLLFCLLTSASLCVCAQWVFMCVTGSFTVSQEILYSVKVTAGNDTEK